jgi:hypothetical protein
LILSVTGICCHLSGQLPGPLKKPWWFCRYSRYKKNCNMLMRVVSERISHKTSSNDLQQNMQYPRKLFPTWVHWPKIRIQ